MTSANQDHEHLRLLSIFYYVVAGLTALFSLFFVIYLVLGVLVLIAPDTMADRGEAPPAFIGWIFIVLGTAFILAGVALAVCMILTGRFLAQRKRYLFCLVVAAISCLMMPFGTVLGVFTIVVLMRPSVKQLFAAPQPAPGLP